MPHTEFVVYNALVLVVLTQLSFNLASVQGAFDLGLYTVSQCICF